MYRGPDQGGGVAGLNYAEKTDGTGLNYKFYNLRGDVVLTRDTSGSIKTRSKYEAFGEHRDTGEITTDKYRANTKYEGDFGLLNEGKRWRSLKYGVFLTPDPLEYVDGPNPYIYCNQNPWGRWDPLGLDWTVNNFENSPRIGERNVGGLDKGNGIKGAWICFKGSSNTVINSIELKYIATEVNIEYKNTENETKVDSIIVARKLTEADVEQVEGGYRVKDTKIKGFAQDGGNIVEIMKKTKMGEDSQSLSITVRPGLFEGDLDSQESMFKKSDVEFADWNRKKSAWIGAPEGQTQDKWSSYAQSQIGSQKAYIPKNSDQTKKLEDIKDKPIDVSNKPSKNQTIDDVY